MRLSLTILFSFAALSAVAEELTLRPPLECGPSTDTPCIIQQYVDTDTSAGASDFTCGTLSYDGHKGTDFRVATLADMNRGAVVVASASGEVKAVRDGMADTDVNATDAPNVAGRECGNGVVVDHGNGWETQYCHLKKGSITVTKGQRIEAGDPLGLVGLSGMTAFPHVHLSVRKDGAVIDPFNPETTPSCGGASRDLWDDSRTPVYRAGGILNVGLHDAVPEFDDIKRGGFDPDTLTKDAPALVLWAYVFGAQAGDTLRLKIDGPDDWTFATEAELEKTQAQLFRAGGKRRPSGGWPIGTYNGSVLMLRDGDVLGSQTVQLHVTR